MSLLMDQTTINRACPPARFGALAGHGKRHPGLPAGRNTSGFSGRFAPAASSVPCGRLFSPSLLAWIAVLFGLTYPRAHAESPAPLPPAAANQSDLPEERIVEVRIEGNHATEVSKLPKLVTRAGQTFDARAIEEDVRTLHRTRKFVDVHPKYVRVAEGIVVIFQVVERPMVRYVRFVGNEHVMTRTLRKKSEMEVGDSIDPYTVEEARRRVEAYYHEKGYDKARVTTVEGSKPGDKGAVFLVDEGRSKKSLWTTFVGNTIASDARLLTQIQSKPGILWMLGGDVDREKIDADVTALTAYYRSLGFFQAKVGRELSVVQGAGRDWTLLTFVVNEGPRYSVRNVSFVGNTRFKTEFLERELKLTPGQPFVQSKMDLDLNMIRDIYGGRGFVFADIRADPRFLEEPGQLDLVYNVTEGQRYRVGKINVRIRGEHPHTKHATILNRLSLRPGDILDIRKLREDERRLKSSSLFLSDAAKGEGPRIVFSKPDESEEQRRLAESPDRPGFRGQSPDGEPGDVVVDLVLDGTLAEELAEPGPVVGRATGAGPADDRQAPNDAPKAAPPMAGLPVWRGQSPQPSAPFAAVPPMGPPQPQAQPPLPAWGGRPLAPTGPEAVDYSRASPPAPVSIAQAPAMGQPPFPQQPGAQPLQPIAPGFPPPVAAPFPQQPVDVFPGNEPYVVIDVDAEETQTGRLMIGAGVNSNAGLVGNIVIDEQNFDLFRLPRSWDDIRNGVAFRGAGQRFRLEAAPGTELQRYTATFQEPYLFDTRIGLSASGSYFTRYFFDWAEGRIGGRLGLGYQFAFAPDLSVTGGFRGENVDIYNPRLLTPDVIAMRGTNSVYGFSGGLIHDTRDSPFLPTQGHLATFEFEQVIGSFVYPRGVFEGRQYFLLRERPDGSGRHVLSIGSVLGMSGPDTPAYDNFYAGGYNTLRGFTFRGASPRQTVGGTSPQPGQAAAIVGGPFEWLNTIEYLFPITADDSLRGVVFTDFGTVESNVSINNFRVAPGFGLRITLPAMGPAPIALDFAVPVAYAPYDSKQLFSFFVGFAR
jgi:outer membrane protein insertion porin family